MLQYLFYTAVVIAILAIIGFIRSVIDKKANTMVIDVTEKTKLWLSENTITARFSLLFLPFIVLYNVFIWAVFGVISIIEFFIFLFTKLWWLILWIWHEVLHPTVFALVKLLWHYLVVFCWKFFAFSFRHIKESVSKPNILFAIKKLMAVGVLFAILLILNLLFRNLFPAKYEFLNYIIAFISVVIFLFYFQYAIFRTLVHLRPNDYTNEHIRPTFRLSAIWFILSVISAALMAAVYFFGKYHLVKGPGFDVTLVAFPVFVLTAILFFSAFTCLPAYISEKGRELDVFEYLKTLLFRLPKLIFAQPFQVIGIVILAIVPFLIAWSLNHAITTTTTKPVKGWIAESLQMQRFIPRMMQNNKTIAYNDSLVKSLIQEKDTGLAKIDKVIQELQNNESEAVKIKESIKSNEIHTYSGEPTAGESQFFSVPALPSCGIYKWVIKDADTGNDIYTVSLPPRDSVSSSYIEFVWPKEGNYVVTLYPQNACGAGVEATRNITVLPRAKGSFAAGAPMGKPQVCVAEEVPFVAPAGYQSYEWQLPDGSQIVSDNPADARVTIKFGNQSGTVRVRVTNNQGQVSLWAGTNVVVNPLPGNENKVAKFTEDEKMPSPKSKPFTFATREAATDSIAAIQSALKEQNEIRATYVKEMDENIAEITKSITQLKNGNMQIIFRFVSIVFVLLGLVVFFSILLSVLFIYILLYHFELLGFEQKGPHYWETVLSGIRAKNPKQPLLGLFVLLFIHAILIVAGPHCRCLHSNDCQQNTVKEKKIMIFKEIQQSSSDTIASEVKIIPG